MRGERRRNGSGLSWVVKPAAQVLVPVKLRYPAAEMQGSWNRSWWGILVFLDPHDRAYVAHTFCKGFIRWSFCERTFRAENLQWNQNITKLANQSLIHRWADGRSCAVEKMSQGHGRYLVIQQILTAQTGIQLSSRVRTVDIATSMGCEIPTTDSCIGPCNHDLISEMMYRW